MTAAWLAGFFDGEGCVRLEHQKGYGYYARLTLTQKDRRVLRAVMSDFGGHLYDKSRSNPCATVTWDGKKAVALARLLLPHSFCKRKQLECLIRAYEVPAREREIHRTALDHHKKEYSL